MGAHPFSGRLGVEEIRGGCAQTYQQLACFFICTKLTMPVWGMPLFNMADFVVYNPPGAKFWPSSMHESFVLGLIYPLISHRPWWIRVTAKVLGLVRAVSLLIQESPGDAGIVLLQLWLLPKMLDSMSGELARELILS